MSGLAWLGLAVVAVILLIPLFGEMMASGLPGDGPPAPPRRPEE